MGTQVERWLATWQRSIGTHLNGAHRYRLPRRLVTLGLSVLVAGAALSFSSLLAAFLEPPLLYLRDFVQDWLWARALRDGLAPYAPTPTLASLYFGDCCPVHLPHASSHPPLAGLLVLPLSWLDLYAAALVWVGIELVCLAVALRLLTRQSWTVVAAITGALLAWHPLRTELIHGQFTTIQLLLLVLARQYLESRQEIRAGVLVGLALCVKPIVAPLVLLFALQRRLPVLLGIGATVAAVGLLSFLLLGTEGIVQFISQLPQTGQLYQDYLLNISIWAVGGKLAPEEPLLATGISLLAGLLFVGGVGALVQRARNQDLAYGAVVAASTILNPVAWDIYMLLALLPIVQVAHVLRACGWPRRELAIVLLLGLGALVPTSTALPPLFSLIPLLVLVGLTLYVSWLALVPSSGARMTWTLLSEPSRTTLTVAARSGEPE